MTKVNKNKKFIYTLAILTSLIIVSFLVSLNMGSLKIGAIDVIKTFLGQGSRAHEIALFRLRLPRIVIGILVGTA